MKKLSGVIILLFCAFISFAQTFPNNTSQSNASTKTNILGALTSLGYQPKQFTDTISANVVPYLKNTPYVIVAIGNNLYMRNGATTQWLFVGGISGGGGGGGGIGIDSVVLRNFVLCQWKSGVSTCYNIDTSLLGTKYFITRYVDSSVRNYNTVNGVDSTTIKLSGSVTITSGFMGQTTVMGYKILGRYYTAPPSAFTLPSSNVSSDKFAIVYGDTLGNIGVLSGVGSNPASIPLDQINPRSQIVLAIYLIKANSVTPDGVINLAVYQENIEWTGVTNVAGGIFNYTTNPRSGSVSTYLPNFTSSQSCYFQDVSFRDFRTNSFVKFWIKLSAPPTGNIFVEFTGTGNVTSNVFLSSRHGYNPNLTAWQFIAIDASEFNLLSSSVLFNKLQFFLTGTGTVQLDDIFLQQGGTNVPTNTGVKSVNGNPGPYVNFKYYDSSHVSADGKFYDYFQKGLLIGRDSTYRKALVPGTNVSIVTSVTGDSLTINSTGGSASRFGIEDNTGLQNRTMDLNNYDLYIPYNSSENSYLYLNGFANNFEGRISNSRVFINSSAAQIKYDGGGLINSVTAQPDKTIISSVNASSNIQFDITPTWATIRKDGEAVFKNIVTSVNGIPANDTGNVVIAGGGGSTPDSSWVTGEFGIDGLRVGTILNENFPGASLPATFTVSGTTATIGISNKVTVSGGNNTATNYLQGVSFYNFDKQKTSITVIPQDRTGTSYGIGLTQGNNALNFSSSFDIRFNLTSGTDSGRASFNGVYSPNLYFIATDTLLCEYERDNLYQTVSILNKRTGKKTSVTIYSGWGTGGALRLVFYGGSQHITNVKIESFNLKNTGVAIIGTSISSGSGASSESSAWQNLLFGTNKYRYSNYSHPSITMDKWIISDWPNLKLQNPKYAFLEIGYNDRRDMTGDSAAYKIQVNKILDSLTTYGIIPILATLTPTILNPGASIDNTSVMLQNLAISRGLKIADVRTPLLNGGTSFYSNYNADGTHPSDSGHIVYANVVKQVFNDAFELYVGDSTSHLKVHNLPTGNEGMNFMAVDIKGNVFKVPNTIPGAGKFIQNKYTSIGGSVAQPLTEIHTSFPVISDSSLQVNSPYGLRIGFHDGSLTAGVGRKSNINITNTGIGGTGYPQVFDNLTGLRNIKMFTTDAPAAIGSITISGNDNTSIQTGGGTTGSRNVVINSISLPTSGSDNIGIGLGALKSITSGSNNIHIANITGGDFSNNPSNTVFIGDPQKTNNIKAVSGDIVISTPTAGSTQFWLGGKSDVLTDIYFNIPAPAGYGNSAGASWYLRAGIGTGTAQPGQFIFQHSTPAGSSTAIHTAFTNTLTLARTLVTATVPVQATQFQTAASVFWSSGIGSPESVITANVGSMYTRTDGGAGATLYVKESGTGNTGWIGK